MSGARDGTRPGRAHRACVTDRPACRKPPRPASSRSAPAAMISRDDHVVQFAGDPAHSPATSRQAPATTQSAWDWFKVARADGFDTGTGEEAVRLALVLTPDVVLMHLRFAGTSQGIDGMEAIRWLAADVPGLPVVMLTSYSGQADVVRALEAGARGYVLKAGPPEVLFRALAAPPRAVSASRRRWSAASPGKWSVPRRN